MVGDRKDSIPTTYVLLPTTYLLLFTLKMIGIDIVDIERVEGIYQKHGRLFLEKILGDEEIESLSAENNRHFFKNLSAYIAAKEAIFKACSQEKLDWREISIREIRKNPLICIKRPGFTKKIKLTFAINSDIIISQAIIV